MEVITIPVSVTSLDEVSLVGSNQIKTVYGTSGSYAETWVAEKGYTFIAI